MICESNPRFKVQVVGCGVPSLAAPIVEFAMFQRDWEGVVSTEVGHAKITHEQASTASKRPTPFKNLPYPSLIEIDGRRLDGGMGRVPWPESSQLMQHLKIEYQKAGYSFVTTLQLFFPLTGDIPQRCQWIWSCYVEDFCENVYRFCPLPDGAYCATYQCADHGVHTVDSTKQLRLKDPSVIAMKKSFLAGLSELAAFQKGNNIIGQEFGAI